MFFPVLGGQEWYLVWLSAAAAHLFQGMTNCTSRDALLHTLVVTSEYLGYCCLGYCQLKELLSVC